MHNDLIVIKDNLITVEFERTMATYIGAPPNYPTFWYTTQFVTYSLINNIPGRLIVIAVSFLWVMTEVNYKNNYMIHLNKWY